MRELNPTVTKIDDSIKVKEEKPAPSTTENIAPAPQPVKPLTQQPASYGVTLGSLQAIKKAAKDKLIANQESNTALVISAENLQQAWTEVVEKIAAEKMLYKSAILESQLSFVENEITIYANVVAFDFLKSERLRLLDFFKQYFKNESVNVLFANKLEAQIASSEKVLSTREIFDLMAERNPNLRQLKDKFGLDFEY